MFLLFKEAKIDLLIIAYPHKRFATKWVYRKTVYHQACQAITNIHSY